MSWSRKRTSPVSRYSREPFIGWALLRSLGSQLSALLVNAPPARRRSSEHLVGVGDDAQDLLGQHEAFRVAERSSAARVSASTRTCWSETEKRIVTSPPDAAFDRHDDSSSTAIRRSSLSSTVKPATLPRAVAARRATRAMRLSAGKVSRTGPSTARAVSGGSRFFGVHCCLRSAWSRRRATLPVRLPLKGRKRKRSLWWGHEGATSGHRT